MKIVFYNETLLSGGIEKCIELLNNYISKEHEIEIVYIDDSKVDSNIVNVLSKNANIHKLEENEVIEADLCIWCRIYFNYEKLMNQIRAKRNILWVHSRPREKENCLLDVPGFIDKIDKIVCVSEAVKNEVGIEDKSVVIHNFIDDEIVKLAEVQNPFKGLNDDCLKMAIVARISVGKGFDRVLEFIKVMKRRNISFALKIVGKGRGKEKEIKEAFSGIDEVEFVRI
ncbi:MAG: hypothetical protein IKF52_06960 [Clostridia bacterium]|nr:hypothetical protein [Clostridia bacterium]